jgi:aminoglycoside/choline kinase family phosphotransferase
MDAPPEKEDSAAFIKIATLLRTNNLHAPKIITSDLAQGFLLLEDLGNKILIVEKI